MSKSLPISATEIIERLKISRQFPIWVREVVRQQIISDAAKAEGIVVSDRELQAEADNFRVQQNLYDSETTWQWLKQHHLTGDEFEKLIYESIVKSKLIQHLFGDRVEPYFYEHQLDYTQAALYEVVFADFDTALEVFYALEEQEITFLEVARQYIQEPNLRRQYGYQGVRSRTALNSAISAAVFAATPPQILKPIVVDRNTHLILVEEIIKPQLDEALQSQILSELFSDWLEQQLRQYSIEVTTLLELIPEGKIKPPPTDGPSDK